MVTHKANRHTLLFPGALVGGDNPLVVGGVCAVDCIPCVRWKHETVIVSIAFEFVELRLLVCINFLCIGLVFLLGMHRPHCGNFSARPKNHELLKCSPHVLRAPLRLSQGKKRKNKSAHVRSLQCVRQASLEFTCGPGSSRKFKYGRVEAFCSPFV